MPKEDSRAATIVGLAAQQTRKLAVIGLIGYLLYLTGNAVRNR